MIMTIMMMMTMMMINDSHDNIFVRFANAVEDGTSCGGSGLQLCLAGVCEVGQRCLLHLLHFFAFVCFALDSRSIATFIKCLHRYCSSVLELLL